MVVQTARDDPGPDVEETVPITANFIPVQSSEAAATLHRTDEEAYRRACGRVHVLRLKRRKRPHRTPVSDGCAKMIQHGEAMKKQASIPVPDDSCEARDQAVFVLVGRRVSHPPRTSGKRRVDINRLEVRYIHFQFEPTLSKVSTLTNLHGTGPTDMTTHRALLRLSDKWGLAYTPPTVIN